MGLGEEGTRFYLSGRITKSKFQPSYPLSFAYSTGPAYGLLLDQGDPNWRKKTGAQFHLAEALADLNQITLPANVKVAALKRSENPEDQQIFREETAREKDRIIKEKSYRKMFVTDALLILPGDKGLNRSFNPSTVFPLGDDGTIYPTSKVSGSWGVIESEKGIRINSDGSQAFVPAPTSADHLLGDGWKLTLNPGWRIIEGIRKGDFTLAK